MTHLVSSNKTGDEWFLLTPTEWILEGFTFSLVPGHARRVDDELENLINDNWERRQKARQERNFSPEQPWKRTGYHDIRIDYGHRHAEILARDDSNWKSLTGTNLNPDFISVLLQRYNSLNKGAGLKVDNLAWDRGFSKFALPYLDNALASCVALRTPNGVVVGARSPDLGHYPGSEHVFGSWLQDINGPIYRKPVPVVDGKPIVNEDVFTGSMGSVAAHSKINLFDETGCRVMPKDAELELAGIVYELPHHTVEFVYCAKTDAQLIGHDYEHTGVRAIPMKNLPAFLNNTKKIVPAGQFALVAALVKERGMDAVKELSVVRRISI